MISHGERVRLRNAFIELNRRFHPGRRDDIPAGGVSQWFKQDEIHAATHVHTDDPWRGIAFLPWHRELCNRLEGLLREVDPQLSLHYWDWTTDPRNSPDGDGGAVNLFSAEFMGAASGVAGEPWLSAGVYAPAASPDRDTSRNPFDPPRTLIRAVGSGAPTLPWSDAEILDMDTFPAMRARLEEAHNFAHGYLGGTIQDPHRSFRDPFVFLLHSNVDRLFALWQLQHGKGHRLDPEQVYGAESNSDVVPGASVYDPGILTPMDPWAGNPNSHPLVKRVRPWAPPENEHLDAKNRKNSKHPSVVAPPGYDTNLPIGDWSLWTSGGGVLTLAPALGHNRNGRLEVFIRGTDNALWHKWQTAPGNGWSGWHSQGGILTSNVATGQNQDGRIEVFVRGTENALWHKWQTTPSGAWSGWHTQGGVLTSEIAVGRNADGRLEIFARGTDNALWHKWQTSPNGAWSQWQSQGGVLTSDIAVVPNHDGRQEVFVRGTDNALWHKWQTSPNGGWSNWHSLGGVLTSNISSTRNRDGRLEVFARGTDNALWHVWQTTPGGAWSGWHSEGGVLTSNVASFPNASGRLEVFVRGTDNALWHKWQTAPNGGWSPWAWLSGVLTSDPVVGPNLDGRLEVFVRGTDNALWHIWQREAM